VVAQHLERQRLTGAAQLDALVGNVTHQAPLGELLDHARGRRRRDVQPLGERVRGHGLALATALEGVDRLHIVLHRLGVLGVRGHQTVTRRLVA
jgi:hypothetical protein